MPNTPEFKVNQSVSQDIASHQAGEILKSVLLNPRSPDLTKKPCNIFDLNEAVNQAMAIVFDKHPFSPPIVIYRLFSQTIPYFISQTDNQTAIHAISDPNPDIAKSGRNVLTMLNMKKILTAAEPYFSGNPTNDSVLLQAGITNLLWILRDPPIRSPITSFIRYHVNEGILMELAQQKDFPTEIVEKGVAGNIEKAIRESLKGKKTDLLEEERSDLVKGISGIFGITPASAEYMINKALFLSGVLAKYEMDTSIVDSQLDSGFLLDKALEILPTYIPRSDRPDRYETTIRARYGLLDVPKIFTLYETGQMIEASGERTRQIEARGLSILRAALKYIYKQYHFIHNQVPEPIQTTENITAISPLANVPFDPSRLKYKYPLIELKGKIDVDIAGKLKSENIKTFADLLLITREKLVQAGFEPNEIAYLRHRIIQFLWEDLTTARRTYLKGS